MCESVLEANDIPFHLVKGRIKSAPSALEKIIRKGYEPSLKEVTDLIGIRVIVLYPSHIDSVLELLKKEFTVIETVDKRPGSDSDQFGYSSVHILCNMAGTQRAVLPEHADFAEIPFEIQIRTILQEAWAEIEHRLVYKSQVEAPKEIKRLIKRLSSSLEIADEQFQEIYEKRQTYVQKLKESDQKRLSGEPLNVDSILEVIRRRFSWAEGWEEGDDAEAIHASLAELVDELQVAGIATVDRLTSILNKWQDEAYRESHRVYQVVSGEIPPRKEDGRYIPEGMTGLEWHQRTEQYFTPIGHIRMIVEMELPK